MASEVDPAPTMARASAPEDRSMVALCVAILHILPKSAICGTGSPGRVVPGRGLGTHRSGMAAHRWRGTAGLGKAPALGQRLGGQLLGVGVGELLGPVLRHELEVEPRP